MKTIYYIYIIKFNKSLKPRVINMAFQIRNNDLSISMKELNKEAASFYNVPYPEDGDFVSHVVIPDDLFDKDRSAYSDLLKKHVLLNWYDRIGGSIHFVKATTWEQVRTQIIAPFVKSYMGDGMSEEEATTVSKEDKEYNKPLLDLCTYWEQKGYTPHFVND